MKKTFIKNLGVYLNPKFRKSDHRVARKTHTLPPILNIIANHQSSKNNLHVVKWVDLNGFINVAFQIVAPHRLGSETDLFDSTSVVFSQTHTDKIMITAIHVTTDGLVSKNEHKKLGSCGFEDLTELFIMEKINQVLDNAKVA